MSNNSYYTINDMDRPSFTEVGSCYLIPNGRYRYNLTLFNHVFPEIPCIVVSASLFSILCNIDLLNNNILIYELASNNNLYINNKLIIKVGKDIVKKTNVITYEVFCNYIKSNIKEVISWINIISSDLLYYSISHTTLSVVFMNLYKMNICREYIKDIAESKQYNYYPYRRLMHFINSQN